MRTWKLGNTDPLHLTLAADARLCKTDYGNDVIWELNPGQGEPHSLAVQTTFGLRARWMQFFPIFTRSGEALIDPAEFFRAPQFNRILPNYLDVNFSPYEGIEVQSEYWTAESQVLAGRISLTNKSILTQNARLDWAGLLSPMGPGEVMAALPMGMGTALQGRTNGISVVCFLSGGAQDGKSPYPSLSLQLEIYPGTSATYQWAVAAHADMNEAFELARRTTSRPWEAEMARIELLNTAETFEVTTGSPDWDVAFDLGQKAALGLMLSSTDFLPYTSFALSRRIDQGFSIRPNGSDHPYLWSGQTVLDTFALAGMLPGAPHLVEGLVRNFLINQQEQGYPDWKPGLGGQHTHQIAQPLLATLALQSGSIDFLKQTYPGLLQFFHTWMSSKYDQDGDGFPEWEHPLQTGLESSPLYDRWHSAAQGVDIGSIEAPGLGAMLYRECTSLSAIGRLVGATGDLPWLADQAARLRKGVEACWDKRSSIYRYRDALTHISSAGKQLIEFMGSGIFTVQRKSKTAQRLVIQMTVSSEGTRAATLNITGKSAKGITITEKIAPREITWSGANGRATTHQVFSQVNQIEAEGFSENDSVAVLTVDLTQSDCSLFLPLWAGIPDAAHAKALVEKNLLATYLQPYGVPVCPPAQWPDEPPELACTAIPWNTLIGEGLLNAGYRQEAAGLVTSLMQAVLGSLKQDRGFRQYYNASTGQGMGERDHLWGLPPLDLFLKTAGFVKIAPKEIIVRDFNPFPWPIHVKYQRMMITREGDKTILTLPGKKPITITGPQMQRVSLS